MIMILILGAVPLVCPENQQIKHYPPIYKNKLIETLLIDAESGGSSRAVSRAGARGKYQIHRYCLDHYNQLNRKRYDIYEMHDSKKARIIYVWYMRLMETSYFKGHPYYLRLLFCVNSYNMGASNTKRGKFNVTYVRKICPQEWEAYIINKKIRYWRRGLATFARVY